MQITARMFADRLDELLINLKILGEGTSGYETVQFVMPGQLCLKAGQAYVVEGELLCKLAEIDSSCLIICTQEHAVDLPCSVLFCRGSLSELYQAALEAVRHYSDFEKALNDGLLGDKDLDYFLQVCAAFFGNVLQIMDPALNVVSGVFPIFEGDGSKPSSYLKFDPALSPETISEMAKLNLLRETYEFKSAQYHKNQLFDYGAIHLNLFEGDKYLGRLILVENHKTFTPGVADTVNQIGKYFRHLMNERSTSINAYLFTSEYFISEILSGRISDAAFITSQLSGIGWGIGDPYRVLFVQVDSQALQSYTVQALSNLFRNAMAFPIDGGVVAVIRVGEPDQEELVQQAADFLQGSNLCGGLSETFHDFLAASSYFVQAKGAALLGAKSSAAQRLFHYRDHANDHFISAAVAMNYGSAFMHPAFRVVKEYDRDNGTDFLETLKEYLENGMNQVLTAKRLHIHRNSLKYRLARLKELSGIDLDDVNERLRLILTFRLNEFTQEGR